MPPPPPDQSRTPPQHADLRSAPPDGNGVAPLRPAKNDERPVQQAATQSHHPFHPREWALWQRPKRVVVALLAMELLAVAVFAVAIAHSEVPSVGDWIRFAILAAGATVHIQLTQRQEERRRNRTRTVLIDLTAVWTFPAAVIFPVPLTLLLVALIRLQHWFIARRPAHNFVFSSIAHGLSGTLAQLTFVSLAPYNWGSLGGLDSLHDFGGLVLAGLVFEAVQILYVGSILALSSSSRPTVGKVLGNKADNLLEAITIGLGAVTAVLLVIMPPAVAIMAVVTVVFNRLAELDQLQDDVRTDSKTGALNMRGWNELAERGLERARKSEDDIALLMIDLDHFKWINDSFGHPAGDDVLQAVAEALREVTRPSDVVGRFGGEEFLILLPDMDERAALQAAERVRRAIADLRIVTTDKRGSQTTINRRTTSVGVAIFPQHADSLEGLMHAADAAVYEAKEAGRNQVRIATRNSHAP
ncbi:diguanylate cyclase (GGDEF) domain-containing protein [Amycolatopsis marina]|uniref:Diguanylate cyclase (GGDEF) domain-containing protein n=2 Tax=Amycolatopsis marina TaxID=490629 RepID=A0A1I0YL29_9PSEU|nr:diguanylate cyclase (GGDEF) domain-containing protein [Amycolatopsis marina]